MNLEAMTQEFLEYELDPSKINTKKIHEQLMMLKQTLDLSSTTAVLAANSTVASLNQVLSFKANRCAFWEGTFKHKLEHSRLQTKYSLLDTTRAADNKITKEELADKVELDPAIVELKDKLMSAELGRKFWDRMLDMLNDISKRIDSAGMQLGVQAKLKPSGS
jgi:hypothetical protein